MIITLENGERINGGDIFDAVFRTSLEPIPCSLEMTVHLRNEYSASLMDGKVLCVGKFQTPVKIVFVEDSKANLEQGGAVIYRHVIALHENSAGISHRLEKAVIRENVLLSEIYRSCGGTSGVGRDFSVPRFYCYRGYYPSVEIAQACQDNGGVIRLDVKTNKIEFWRVYDLFSQKEKAANDVAVDLTFRSGFLERHELPVYVSTNPDGTFSTSSFSSLSARSVEYVPNRNQQALNARSSVLLNAKELPMSLNPDINAGDLLNLGSVKFIVITAAHRVSNTGASVGDSTTLWLGVKS